MSVDPPGESRALVHELGLSFRVLSDERREVIAAYGLAHEGGGPHGETIAVPAMLLVERDGGIVWRHVARRITDRAVPSRVLEALELLRP